MADPKKKSGILKKIFIAFVIIMIVFVIVVALQPKYFYVTRSATMSAPADVVFAQVNDFHNWDGWSPWAKLDPAVKNTFEGPASGTGAKFSWVGNDKVGEGHMTIVASRSNELVRIKLDFIKPFESTCTVEFAFKPEGEKTSVSWSMSGENNFIGKAFSLFMNMDKMLGGEFEKGLSQMRSVAEGAAKK